MTHRDDPEFVDPPTNLVSKVDYTKDGVDLSALEEAENLVEGMRDDYIAWAQEDLKRLRQAYQKAEDEPDNLSENFEQIFEIAHDMKGQGGTFNFHLVTEICDNLCRLIEKCDPPRSHHLHLVKLHVDAITLVLGNKMDGDGGEQGKELVAGIQAVVSKVLKKEGKATPEA